MKYKTEERKTIVERYLKGESPKKISEETGMDRKRIAFLAKKYEKYGIKGIEERQGTVYSEAFKKELVERYLEGGVSREELAVEYNLSSRSTITEWVKRYNREGEEKGGAIMPKGRQTTLEEREKIVTFCLEHEQNYRMASELFNVTYKQVYNWVKKYKTHGIIGLEDNRGKNKEAEKSDYEKALEKIKLLEMEIDYLKKVEELNGRWEEADK